MSSPSMRIAPDCGSKARWRSPSVVDLPEPVEPTSAMVSPGFTAKDTSAIAVRFPSYENDTFENSTAPAKRSMFCEVGRSCTVGEVSRTS